MIYQSVIAAACLFSAADAYGFSGRIPSIRTASRMEMSTVTAPDAIQAASAPDFYWQYRLDRLVGKKGSELPYSSDNYPEGEGSRGQYDAYYLDLTLQGKMEGFDWRGEKEISDDEWMTIYNQICKWSQENYAENKPDMSNLPENDFDLLKKFYPQLNMRDLSASFTADEVGADFPYSNMGEMLSAAVNGKLSVPGYTASSVTSLDASECKTALSALKESTMAKVDGAYAEAMAFAENSLPDQEAKDHYKALKTKLAGFPQDSAGWAKFRADMEKEVDEMARLASKPVEHGHHGEDCVTPAQEFEAKYGKSLEEMQARFDKFKSDPEGFLENSIVEKYGKAGLDVWKKSQEFSKSMEVMSEAEKANTEKAFSDFVNSA